MDRSKAKALARFVGAVLVAVVVLVAAFPAQPALAKTTAARGTATIDISAADQGIVAISYDAAADQRYRVLVEKDGRRYTYVYQHDANFPLQMGSGAYTVKLLENIGGTEYRTLKAVDFNADIADANSVFLQSAQLSDWQNAPAATEAAAELVKGLSNDQAKVQAIHDYVVGHVKYDSVKLSRVTTDTEYVPSAAQTLTDGSGICYDFASLMAAMLRSVGIPAKLVKGYSVNIAGYHAWNEVYLDGQWQVLDASYDAQLAGAGYPVKLFKSQTAYNAVNEY